MFVFMSIQLCMLVTIHHALLPNNDDHTTIYLMPLNSSQWQFILSSRVCAVVKVIFFRSFYELYVKLTRTAIKCVCLPYLSNDDHKKTHPVVVVCGYNHNKKKTITTSKAVFKWHVSQPYAMLTVSKLQTGVFDIIQHN